MESVGHIEINENFSASSFSKGLLDMWNGFLRDTDKWVDGATVSTEPDEWSSDFGCND